MVYIPVIYKNKQEENYMSNMLWRETWNKFQHKYLAFLQYMNTLLNSIDWRGNEENELDEVQLLQEYLFGHSNTDDEHYILEFELNDIFHDIYRTFIVLSETFYNAYSLRRYYDNLYQICNTMGLAGRAFTRCETTIAYLLDGRNVSLSIANGHKNYDMYGKAHIGVKEVGWRVPLWWEFIDALYDQLNEELTRMQYINRYMYSTTCTVITPSTLEEFDLSSFYSYVITGDNNELEYRLTGNRNNRANCLDYYAYQKAKNNGLEVNEYRLKNLQQAAAIAELYV